MVIHEKEINHRVLCNDELDPLEIQHDEYNSWMLNGSNKKKTLVRKQGSFQFFGLRFWSVRN